MLEAEETFGELCERFGISRKQGYKWKERYEEGGVAALVDRSRAPHSHPHAVSAEVVQLLVTARKKHPRWGPRKLLVVVRRHHPKVGRPSSSTVGAIFKKLGMIGPRKRVRRSDPYKERLGPYDGPNRIWCADFKGHFWVDEERCSPLTVSDGFSRYLLTCKALRSTICAPVMRSFETAKPPAGSFRAQQARFDRFREEYNKERPHEAIGQATPSSLYRPALRAFPNVLPELEYADHFELCRTYPNGVISWRGIQWYLSGCLQNELVGLEELPDDRWRVFFGPVLLGVIDVKLAYDRRNYRRFGVLVRADGEVRRRRRKLYRR